MESRDFRVVCMYWCWDIEGLRGYWPLAISARGMDSRSSILDKYWSPQLLV